MDEDLDLGIKNIIEEKGNVLFTWLTLIHLS